MAMRPHDNSRTARAAKGAIRPQQTQLGPQQRPSRDLANRSSAAEDVDEETDDEYDEPSLLSVWWGQSPSMLASMVVHMAVVLMLALYVIRAPSDPDRTVLLLPEEPPPPETPALEEHESDFENDQIVPIEKPVEVETPDIPEDASPTITESDDTKKESVPVEPTNEITKVVSGKSTTAGNAKSGLGGRLNGIGTSRLIRQGDPGGKTVAATDLALEWLARHQNRDGSWSFNHTPGDRCSGFPNPGEKRSKMGATGLALLAFLGRGHTHEDKTKKHHQVVHRGLSYLISHMEVKNNTARLFESDGDSHSHMYCHGIAACALAEAYGMTRDLNLHDPSQYALNYIVNAQHADGGWRYLPGEPGDTSAAGWQLMAFKSGKMSYLKVPEHVYPLAEKFLDSVQTTGGAEYRYLPTGGHGTTAATSSIGLLCRVYLGWEQDHPGLRQGTKLISEAGPHSTNMYYNYYATMFMYQSEGLRSPTWKKWNDQIMPYLLETQAKKGGQRVQGSWHFQGDGVENGLSDVGGRLYNTALAAMTLQVYYRYLRVYDSQPRENVLTSL